VHKVRGVEGQHSRRAVLAALGAAALAACAPVASPTPARTSEPTQASDTPEPSASARLSQKPAPAGPLIAGIGRNSAGDITNGPRTTDRVALTFHGAGSMAIARQVLDRLRGDSIHATVFAVGSWLASNPDAATWVEKQGHEVGNHTMHHLPMLTLNEAQAQSEVTNCCKELAHSLGQVGPWFRPSGTSQSNGVVRRAAAVAGYRERISFDIDSWDWRDLGAATIVARVAAQVRQGSIISMHLGHTDTIAALPEILSTLRSRGLQPVTVTELLTTTTTH